MKSVQTGAAGTVDVVDIERPTPGPDDVLLRMRAVGICGTDVTFLHLGGGPFGPGGQMVPVPLGHEPAGEVVEVGANVTGVKVGDRVVVNPQAAPTGIIGCGGALGGYLFNWIYDLSPARLGRGDRRVALSRGCPRLWV
jgi:(R,R)-butanediol dehydrogenase/meso-butanediol dehydrogenase/diacetyl reductase